MRALLSLLMVLVLPGLAGESMETRSRPARVAGPAAIQLAALDDSLPGLFLNVVNDLIRGEIRPERIAYRAPATLILENTRITDPSGALVASVQRAEIDVAVTSLLVGDIVVRRLSLDAPKLNLVLQGDKLNLLEAFRPKKSSKANGSDGGGANIEIRLESIEVLRGGFRFEDGGNVVVDVDQISLDADVAVDVKNTLVTVNANAISAKSGSIQLPQLDIPISNLRVEQAKLVDLKLQLIGVSGQAAGAAVRAAGRLRFDQMSGMELHGHVDAPPETWPARLAPLPFAKPRVRGDVRVSGSLQNPQIFVEGTFDAFEAYGYPVQRGAYRVEVNRDALQIREANARIDGGHLYVGGTLRFPSLELNLEGQADELPAATLLAPAKPTLPTSGKVSGSVQLSGIVDGEHTIDIAASLVASKTRLYGVTLPSPSTLEGNLSVSAEQLKLSSVALQGRGVRATTQGRIRFQKKSLDLDVDVQATGPERIYPELPKGLVLRGATATGRVAGPFDQVSVTANVQVEDGTVYGVPVADVSGALTVTQTELIVQDIAGNVATGSARGTVALRFGSGTPALSGVLDITQARPDTIEVSAGKPLPVQGGLDLHAQLDGSTAAPLIVIDAQGEDLTLQQERLGRVMARLQVSNTQLHVDHLTVEGPMIKAQTQGPLHIDWDSGELRGSLGVERVTLSEISAAQTTELFGAARGDVMIRGTLDAPRVTAWLSADTVGLFQQEIGSGPLVVRLQKWTPQHSADDTFMVQLSSDLQNNEGAVSLRASYALSTELLHAELVAQNLEIHSWVSRVAGLAPMFGNASGLVVVRGPVDALDAEVALVVPSLRVELPNPRANEADQALLRLEDEESAKIREDQGPVSLTAKLTRGQLEATLCAFSPRREGATPEARSPCDEDVALWVQGDGQVSQPDRTLSLQLRGRVVGQELERFWVPLQNQRASIDLSAEGTAKLRLSEGESAVTTEGEIRVTEFALRLPDAPTATLDRPTRISFGADRLLLKDDLRFDLEGSGVMVRGSATPEKLELNVEGTVALALAKLYLEEVSSATGTVQAQLSLRGTSEAPQLRGTVSPNRGASITSRSLRERIEFVGGDLQIGPSRDDGSHHALVARDFSMRLGDGLANLTGQIEVDSTKLRSGNRVHPTRWDLVARGDGIVLSDGRTWMETSFNVGLVGPGNTPTLKGLLELNDGLYRERFEMQNFVLTTRPSRPSEPLSKIVKDALGMEEVALDMDVVVHNFRVRADIISFPLDAQLAGNLRLEDTLRVPNLVGAIEVVDGTVRFPRARMDVTEARVEFPRERAGMQPKLFVSASGELPVQSTGCGAEVPIKLTLEGDTLKKLQMDLSAEEAGQSHTRTHLLATILLGRTLPECVDDSALGDPNAALRAVSSTLTAGFTRQIEAFVADELGSEVQVNLFVEDGRVGGGVRWRLSKRLELEGETGFSYDERRLSPEDDQRAVGSNARARLLLLDHLPLSGDLFLEGGFATPEGAFFDSNTAVELKLKYRVFEH